MTRAPHLPTFVSALLSDQFRGRSFGMGLVVEVLIVMVFICVPVLVPDGLSVGNRYRITPIPSSLVALKAPRLKVAPSLIKAPIPSVAKTAAVELHPKIMSSVLQAPVRKQHLRRDVLAPDTPSPRVSPVSLSLGSSAIPTIRKPREEVQTGGFGDPAGIAPNAISKSAPNIARVGAYDLPQGAGHGNGTGGNTGARGVVSSAGFGSDIASSNANGRGHGGVIQSAGFGSVVAIPASPTTKPTSLSNSRVEAVEILWKPKPAYTNEARKQKIQGDVVLQVMFLASGHVQVENVLTGLGYGLDEQARAAAREIRFTPARSDGGPIDFPAVVTITFELAY